MSLDLPIQLPVEVFSSDDTDAPPLSNSGGAGEFKTLLKACLITGYGTKAPATGWSMPYEDGDKAVFKSTDPRATGFCMRLDNNYNLAGRVACYENMTDIDTGSNKWFDKDIGFAYSSGINTKWRLFVTPVSFLFVSEKTTGSTNRAAFLWFGDMMSFKTADTGNCAIFAVARSGNGANSSSTGIIDADRDAIASDANGNISEQNPAAISIARVAADGFNSGHLGHPIYYQINSKYHLVAPIFSSHKREYIFGHEENLQGRPYWVANLGNGNGGYVYFIPMDYWLL